MVTRSANRPPSPPRSEGCPRRRGTAFAPSGLAGTGPGGAGMSVPRPRNFIKQTAGAPLRPSDEGPNVGDRGDQCRAADAGTMSQPRPRGDEKRARWTLVNLGLTGSRMVEKGRPGHASERRQMPRHAIGAAAVRCELRRGVSGALSSKSDPAEPAAREVLFALLGYRHGPGGGLDGALASFQAQKATQKCATWRISRGRSD